MDPETIRIKAALFTAEAHVIRRILRKLKKARASQRAWLARKVAGTPTTELEALDKRFASIYTHRVNVVRHEARMTHLARMFMRGVAYERVERFAYSKIDFEAVLKIAKRFADQEGATWLQDMTQTFAAWQHDAAIHWTAAYVAHEAKREAEKPTRAAHLEQKSVDHIAYCLSPNRPQIALNMKQQHSKAV